MASVLRSRDGQDLREDGARMGTLTLFSVQRRKQVGLSTAG